MGRRRRDESLTAPLREEKGGGEAAPHPFGEEKGELRAPFWGEWRGAGNPPFCGRKGWAEGPYPGPFSEEKKEPRAPFWGAKRATKSPHFGERVRETSVPILGGRRWELSAPTQLFWR